MCKLKQLFTSFWFRLLLAVRSALTRASEAERQPADPALRASETRYRRQFEGAQDGIRDITERKHLEEARAKLAAAIVESSDDAIIGKDLNGIIISWNAAAERLFGYRAAEVIGRPISLIIPPDLQAEELILLDRLRHGEPLEHF
ncbi:MAG: PAS domain S-box protein, partial [Verrucomicrobiota bacterium]